jgi:hypothetical protein
MNPVVTTRSAIKIKAIKLGTVDTKSMSELNEKIKRILPNIAP